MKKICVYCGSSPGRLIEYADAAQALGKAIVERDIGLVYGGASVGIMGEIAEAVLETGGNVIGVIPEALVAKEVSHHGLTELKIVESMHQRKAVMAELSDGFVALPGGLGTLEELFEMLTWSQLGFHNKPCALLNVNQYYQSLSRFLDHAVEEQFIKKAHREILLVNDQPDALIESMLAYKAPRSQKWISSGET